jgi:hypothetical protein
VNAAVNLTKAFLNTNCNDVKKYTVQVQLSKVLSIKYTYRTGIFHNLSTHFVYDSHFREINWMLIY